MAYYFLGVAFEQCRGHGREAGNTPKRLSRLIDRVSEYERDAIAPTTTEAHGELDKAIDAYQLGIRNYPRSWGFP